MLKFINVDFSYDQKQVIFNKFNVKFMDRKVNCIIGPSAAGKSTLLNLIAKTIKPNSGTIKNSYRRLSYLFQEERLINEITVFKNLDLILKGVYANHIRRQNLIMAGLKSVGLSEISNWYPDQLSGSMKRRLALLRAFLYPSKLLLMDEPFTGLDINVKQNIINLFLCLWQKDKRTVVFVSHDLDESLLVANHIYVMSQKPMQLLQMVNINQPHSKRTLYHQPIIKTKKVITDLIKLKW